MSFMEHLEELRSRVLRALLGVIVAFLISLSFASPLWRVVSNPAVNALKHLGVNPPRLTVITPMEGFNIIYLKLPLLVAVFLGSPWILYQVWAFISPGLYKREKDGRFRLFYVRRGSLLRAGSLHTSSLFDLALNFCWVLDSTLMSRRWSRSITTLTCL